jgi:hypothetical protein
MKGQAQTPVVIDPQADTVAINGRVRRCYPSPRGLRCFITHAEVKALGKAPLAGCNYELIDGHRIRKLATDEIDDVPGLVPIRTLGEPTRFLIDSLPPAPEAPRRPRGPSRLYGPLVAAARDMAPLLPPNHSLRLALARIDEATGS